MIQKGLHGLDIRAQVIFDGEGGTLALRIGTQREAYPVDHIAQFIIAPALHSQPVDREDRITGGLQHSFKRPALQNAQRFQHCAAFIGGLQ